MNNKSKTEAIFYVDPTGCVGPFNHVRLGNIAYQLFLDAREKVEQAEAAMKLLEIQRKRPTVGLLPEH